jgi:hypothetical protein
MTELQEQNRPEWYPCNTVTGVANGAVDPTDPRNALIQDIDLAPLDAKGVWSSIRQTFRS